MLYPVAVVPFSYATSFLFSTENMSQTVTIFLHFAFGGIGAIAAMILRLIESTYDLGDRLNYWLKIVPSFCLTNPIMFQSSRQALVTQRPEQQCDDMDMQCIGGDLLALGLHAIVWTIVLAAIEAGVFGWWKWIPMALNKNRVPPIENLELEEDVQAEEDRVKDCQDTLPVRVDRFRRVYPSMFRKPTVAVERTSFSVAQGECFALLGVNGAGKTTTFRALTHPDRVGTYGNVLIMGQQLTDHFHALRRHLGYCPQHDDALFHLLTVEEHLHYYARLKGLTLNRQALVDS